MNKSILSLSLSFILICPVFAESEIKLEPIKKVTPPMELKATSDPNVFNLSNIVDGLLNSDAKSEELDESSKTRAAFISATSKFNQGNATSAYLDYNNIIKNTNDDKALISLSRVFYEIGFFSLANQAQKKITQKVNYEDIISDLQKSHKPSSELNKEDEIFFAKSYSNIYFNASAQEAISEIKSKKGKYHKNDYYNYTLARAYYEHKEYKNALNYINKALSLNPENISYEAFKIDILIALKKHKEALVIIKKLENNPTIIVYAPKIAAVKQTVNLKLAKKEKDKKYYSLNKSYIEANFAKTKKDCINVLNFDKKNDRILALYAKSELALGNIDKANSSFVSAYKINKKNPDTLIGLGDIKYLNGDYKNSIKMYKKALLKDKESSEIAIKIYTAQKKSAISSKELEKFENDIHRMPNSAYLDYYRSALTIGRRNDNLKEELLLKALMKNPMYAPAIGELTKLYLKKKNYVAAKSLINNSSITLERNYYYYYLRGLYSQALNNKNEAIQFYRTSISLKPDFEIANAKLLKLIPNMSREEI